MSDTEQKDESQTILDKYDPAKAPFDWEALDKLLQYKPSLIVCADILGVHENSIKNHIKARFSLTYTQYADKKLSATRLRLIQKGLEMALKGDRTMLIFYLKNMCGWQDRIEKVNTDATPIQIEIIPSGNKTD